MCVVEVLPVGHVVCLSDKASVYVRFDFFCGRGGRGKHARKHENNGAGNEALLLPLIDMTNTNTHAARGANTDTHTGTAKCERDLNQSGNKMKPGNGQTGNWQLWQLHKLIKAQLLRRVLHHTHSHPHTHIDKEQ